MPARKTKDKAHVMVQYQRFPPARFLRGWDSEIQKQNARKTPAANAGNNGFTPLDILDWPAAPQTFGHSIISVPIDVTFAGFMAAISSALQKDDGWNNPNPLPQDAEIDHLTVHWGAPPQPTPVRDLVFPVATHLTPTNFERVFGYLCTKNGYDFVMATIRENEDAHMDLAHDMNQNGGEISKRESA